MARRDESECAWCARELNPADCVIGKDWKVYCSMDCANTGDKLIDKDDPRRFIKHSTAPVYQTKLSF